MRSIVTDQVAWSVGLSLTLVSPAKMAEPIEMPFGLMTRVGPGYHVLDGPRYPYRKGAILGQREPKYRDFLPLAVQERPNRSICRLDCGLGWADGSTSSIVFAR